MARRREDLEATWLEEPMNRGYGPQQKPPGVTQLADVGQLNFCPGQIPGCR